jgi:hypothetical protein
MKVGFPIFILKLNFQAKLLQDLLLLLDLKSLFDVKMNLRIIGGIDKALPRLWTYLFRSITRDGWVA